MKTSINRKYSAKTKQITDTVNEFLRRVSRGRQHVERLWFTSILFQRAIQWVSFEYSRGTFLKSNQRRSIPRPVTNKYAESGTTLSASLLNFDPRITYAPQTANFDDLRSAGAANSIVKSIENEVNWFEVRTEAVPWLVYTGNVFYMVSYNPEGGKVLEQKTIKCINNVPGGHCDHEESVKPDFDVEDVYCPKCGEEDIEAPMVEKAESLRQQPQGCMVTEVINPFEMFYDYTLSNFDKSPCVVRVHTKTPEWAQETFGLAEKPQPSRRMELNARFRAGLSNFIPTGEEAPLDQIDVVEAWHKPCKKWPYGFYAVILGQDKLVHVEDYPWVSREGKIFLPFVHGIYERTPGSSYGRTPMFDVIEKQRMRNRVESLGEMVLSRMANPVWILPRGTEVEPSGHIGHKIYYDTSRTAGQQPRRDDAPRMPDAIVHWLDRIDLEIYKLAGIPEITRGERPQSIKTGFGIEKLEAAAQARQSPVFSNLSIAYAKVQYLMLEIFRTVAPPERYMKVFGKSAGWTVQKITELDLKGGVDVWTEPGGSLPKTPLEKQAQLDLFIQSGLVDVSDPMVRYRIYLQYGMEEIVPQMNVDLMQVSREHDRFYSAGTPPQMKPWDNHMVHYTAHNQEMKEEAFEDLDPQMQALFFQHTQEHLIQLQQEAAAQAAQQQGGAPPNGNGGEIE